MAEKLLDERLKEVLSAEDYISLETGAERALARIEKQAPAAVAADVAELARIMRQIEARLLDDRRRQRDTTWAQGSMSTLA